MKLFNTRRLIGRLPHLMRVQVEGGSMSPAFNAGDWLLVGVGFPLREGGVVLARDPREEDRLIVKRLTGLDERRFWLAGDNLPFSTDSRTYGPVAREMLIGPILFRYHKGPSAVRGS